MLGRSAIMQGARLALISAIWLGGVSAHAVSVRCSRDNTYDAAAEASVASLLKARYADAYKAFDLDHPSLVDLIGKNSNFMETANGKSRVPRRSTWLGFRRARNAKTPLVGVPSYIIVGFDRCSGKAVGFQILR